MKIWRAVAALMLVAQAPAFAAGTQEHVKFPDAAGTFYASDPVELSASIETYLTKAETVSLPGPIFAVIVPHAGYPFSGQVAAQAYKQLLSRSYKTVVILASTHTEGFQGIAVYPQGLFRTPLGDIPVDQEFALQLMSRHKEIFADERLFDRQHPIEVQLPFLQKTLNDFRIVPLVMGDVSRASCTYLAESLAEVIGKRNDVLLVASSDMYHGYSIPDAQRIDRVTLSYLEKMDAAGVFQALSEGKAQLCGGLPVYVTLLTAKNAGHNLLRVLDHTNSAQVTGRTADGEWTVGYSSSVIDQPKQEGAMFNRTQRKRLLQIARTSIEAYLKNGKPMEVSEKDALLNQTMGAFVTLHEHGELRGCIGTMVGRQPLYLTVRDMAIEAAVGDPRFSPLRPAELKNVEIEISALSPLEKVKSADDIVMGKHGVILKRGFSSGVFLPQVATETGWTREQFLSQLCAQKAGLAADAWKDPATELYVFTAEVFSEKEE